MSKIEGVAAVQNNGLLYFTKEMQRKLNMKPKDQFHVVLEDNGDITMTPVYATMKYERRKIEPVTE